MKAAKKKKVRRTYGRVRRRRWPPGLRAWWRWNHDLDTILHAMVQNPTLNAEDPKKMVARAAQFADALKSLQDARRPAELSEEDDR